MSAINSVLMTERHYEYRNRKGADRGKSLFERVAGRMPMSRGIGLEVAG